MDMLPSTISHDLTLSAFLSHRWDLIIDLRDLPILFMYDDGVTISQTGINLFLDEVERVNIQSLHRELLGEGVNNRLKRLVYYNVT